MVGTPLDKLESVNRVVVFGRGGLGKSAFALELSCATGLSVVVLDKQFWSENLDPLPPDEWGEKKLSPR